MSWRTTRAAWNAEHANRQVAVIDLGSNSWRLVVFTYVPGAWWKRTDELYETVRIGAGLGATGRLSEGVGFQNEQRQVQHAKQHDDKAGKNDCQTATSSCAGTSKKDAQVLVEKKLVFKTKGGASLAMHREVKVDGTQILLNSPAQANDPPPKPPDLPTRIEVVDDEGNVLAYQRFLITLDDGSEVSGMTDKDGKVELDLKRGGRVRFPELLDVKAG